MSGYSFLHSDPAEGLRRLVEIYKKNGWELPLFDNNITEPLMPLEPVGTLFQKMTFSANKEEKDEHH